MAGQGRRLNSETARAAALKRWSQRAKIAQPSAGQVASRVEFEDAALEREIEQGLKGDAQQRAYELQLLAQAKLNTSTKAAPVGEAVSLNGQAPPLAAGGDEFSPVGPAGSALPVGEGPGSPGPRDLPAPDVPVSPQPAPRPVVGPTWKCTGCGTWCRGWAAMSAHRCGLQPAHAAHAWADR